MPTKEDTADWIHLPHDCEALDLSGIVHDEVLKPTSQFTKEPNELRLDFEIRSGRTLKRFGEAQSPSNNVLSLHLRDLASLRCVQTLTGYGPQDEPGFDLSNVETSVAWEVFAASFVDQCEVVFAFLAAGNNAVSLHFGCHPMSNYKWMECWCRAAAVKATFNGEEREVKALVRLVEMPDA